MEKLAAGLETNELNGAGVIRFDVLPDDVLLDVFDFYLEHDYTSMYDKNVVEAWQTLIHVCRRWRSLVFRSPRRLNLRLCCTLETCTRDLDTLDIWPALPLVVECNMEETSDRDTDNIISALGHSNRVCQIDLTLRGRKGEEALAMMQVPFPELTELDLSSNDESLPVIPDSFLGGSAPNLLGFSLSGILAMGSPNLLLSATHLVHLSLTDIPPSGYISPEAMVAVLSASSSLELLQLESPKSLPDWETRRPSSPKRSILPVLRDFVFEGVNEYLEDLVTLIDTPQLETLEIKFLNELDHYDIPRLAQFINRTPNLGECDEAFLQIDDKSARILFGTGILHIYIPGSDPFRQLSSVRFGSFAITSTIKDFHIGCGLSCPIWSYHAIENTLWLQLMLPFAAVKNLYIVNEFALGVATALQDLVGDRITEVMPGLQNIFVGDKPSFEEITRQFVVDRQLSGHPIAISGWMETRVQQIGSAFTLMICDEDVDEENEL